MPTFSFKISKKKNNNYKTPKRYIKSSIIKEKGIIGVIGITINADYYVSVDNNHQYKIHNDCYSCRRVKKIYYKDLILL